MSRKPRVFIVMLLMAVFLMTQVGMAAAATGDWKIYWNNLESRSEVTGTVYADAYAKVYAQINGNSIAANSVVNKKGAISIPLYDLATGQHNVTMVVYESDTGNFTEAPTTSDQVYNNVTTNAYQVNSTDLIFTRLSKSSSSGGGGGSSTPTTSTNVSASSGGTISSNGATITIPAGALESDVKVTVKKVTNTSGLKFADNSKLVSDVLEIIKDKSGNFEKPVTIKMSFDKSKVDLDKYDLVICWYDETDDKWVALDNIDVDWNAGKVSGEVDHFTKFAVLAVEKVAEDTITLKDIAGHWAEANIKALVEMGAIAGYPDGTFKADNNITRAEFTTVLAKAFNLENKNGKVFADTVNHWAKDAISIAASNGIVSGYNATTFGPDDLVTREQMAVMIVKAANLQKAGENTAFVDNANISAWAVDAVAAAQTNGVIAGYPNNTFKPQGSATRAEAVTVIVKALNK